MSSVLSTGSATHSAHPIQPQHQIQQDTDPLVKYQTLLPILKESVNNLVKHTVFILQNTSSGQCRQNDIQTLNKCMEDFYNINDQVHQWLVLADSTVGQYLMGAEFSTEVTSSFNAPQNQQPESSEPVLSYPQFLSNAKRQVAATEQLRGMLTEFANDLCIRK